LDCTSMEVTVLESNTAPTIDPIDPKSIQAGVPLQFTATAFDTDRPAQTLTFSLDNGAPFGATIDPLTGEFSWTPTPTQATTQYSITVRVTDSGDPPKSATTTFTAAPQGPLTAVTLQVSRLTSEVITVCMQGGSVGAIYNLETTGDLKYPTNLSAW